MVLDPAGPITHRRLIHRRRPTAAAHRCVHRSVQRDCRAIRLDQEKGLPATVQKSPYHSTLIPSTRRPATAKKLPALRPRPQSSRLRLVYGLDAVENLAKVALRDLNVIVVLRIEP